MWTASTCLRKGVSDERITPYPLTIQAIPPPQQVFHVLGHDPGHVLQFRIHPVEIRSAGRLACAVGQRRRLRRPGVLIQPRRLGDECVYGG